MQSQRLVVVAIASLLLLVPAAGATPQRAVAPCDGVRLLARPLLVVGLGDLVLETSGPVDDRVQCIPRTASGPRGSAARRSPGACENAQVSGAQLKPKPAAAAIRCLIDKRRTERGLGELQAQSQLAIAAERHTAHMLSHRCFSHRCSGEPDLVGRITATRYLPCTCAWTVAENLAWGKRRHSTPAAIVAAWMDSPPHRETLLRPGLRDIGVGVEHGEPGNPDAKAATYTADFGSKS